MNNSGFWALVLLAAGVGLGHSAAPDHWAPFAAVGRAQRWSYLKTALVSAFAGFGHVTGSAALGLIGLIADREAIAAFGARFESQAGYLLIAFGLVYALYGWRKGGAHQHVLGGQHFTHHHAHPHEPPHDHRDVTPLSLFVLFSLDPCIAVVPVMFAAASFGALRIAALVAVYEIATIAAIVVFSSLAFAGITRIRWRLLETHGMLVAGLFIAAVGVVVQALGI